MVNASKTLLEMSCYLDEESDSDSENDDCRSEDLGIGVDSNSQS